MSMKKAVLFDLDGTLIDTAADFIRIIQAMCKAENKPIIEASAIRAQVSEGARAMLQLAYPNISPQDEKFNHYRQLFLNEYEKNIAVESQLFEGMPELLATLEEKNILWGIVTNKPRYLSERLLQALKLDQRCAVLVCPEDVKNTKPDPEPMFLAAQQINIDATDIIYAGDHPRDINAGRAAQMYTVLAAYGYLPHAYKDDLSAWQADCIVHNVDSLQESILKQI